ncbi:MULTISPECIES: malonate decarboxylase holo-ACP synthase [Ralstonia]|jgi:phosphoribosyl-dephospho-CoA transferase|uniref:Malonate decarboxylase holo-(Acyl-carrier-protein) synthase n=2 Tax=Ralstonia TaxID=48736 RepID=R0CJG6_RALPI|nr:MULTISPECIES: malonate decarboxylase holo-ACP synthase [Ralstonia]MEA3267883.1 malonate decarboxylase holo-ACP synthase [Pseudomonadota bacterium]ENZ76645.1 malonate decarboxylase holo-(acyl-carrier-protein) synthase [Ralstonia pickettii OR214]MCM3580084.1 malonate decarboxylase holo-ACP synthase [Ralstonia pickettii]MDR9384841.1 malonate decarboxylase holo-ACP synthase [Ralstonia sp. 11b]OYU23732.1 MAG: malonate decarboxylase holo-ACP synthase [Ralstonia sp. PBBBR1]
MTSTPLRAHDLLWVSETPVAMDGAPLPDWAVTAYRQGAPVVVRRAPRGSDGSVPVGLRGGARHERCAATVAANSITRVVSPEGLAIAAVSIAHDAPFAALRTLRALAPALDALGWAWGPTGGAGFTLASGLPVLHADSDLDLLVRMPRAPSTAQRDQLARLLGDTECRVDLQIDTGHGGFALRDWLASPHQTLLKTDHGPRLVADPWSDAA